jgi:Na+-driven multidrug efflux pump
MRNKNLKYNTITSIAYQVIVVVCGFVLPRYILQAFGSEVNGLINSITQFLSIVALMEMGVGAVVSSALYGPIAQKNWSAVSRIVSSADNFFKKIARVLLIYVICLVVAYPSINSSQFDWLFTGSLIVILSINSFAQYYLGIVDNIILGADQRAYISYVSQTVAYLLNTIMCIFVIQMGAGIHVVKGLTAGIYLLRPFFVRVYVRRKYSINRKETNFTDSLKNKWNAVAQHLSECILNSTDVIVLTVFSTLSNVSVYYVYNLVVYNLKNFFLIVFTSGVQAVFGQLYATGEKEKLDSFFEKTEWIIHNLTSLIFGITAVLLVPFIKVYTNNITDADYIQPVFAILLVLAHASHCLRLPYFMMIKAAGHYKQTQKVFILSTIANIVISIILVSMWGLVGVAIGTLAAMSYQTVYLSKYVYRNFLGKKWVEFWKRSIFDTVVFCSIFCAGNFLSLAMVNWWSWLVMAVKISVLAVCIIILINLLFERKKLKAIVQKA